MDYGTYDNFTTYMIIKEQIGFVWNVTFSYDFRHIETKYEAHYRREYILFQEKVIEFFVGRTANIARYLFT